MATIAEYRQTLSETPSSGHGAEYDAKMLHPIPQGEVIDRAVWLMGSCKDEVVLHIGASGPAHVGLRQIAKQVYGWDLRPDHPDTLKIDLDEIGIDLPCHSGVTRIVLGEVLEHLGNPRYLLSRLRSTYPGVHLIISVPNAFSSTAHQWVKEKGWENVNKDHVAWYSYHTLKGLLDRVGYRILFHGWYEGNKQARTAEGLLVVAK